jgi:hypothetical protein
MLGYSIPARLPFVLDESFEKVSIQRCALESSVVAELMQGTTLPKTDVDKSIRKKG